MKMSKWGFTLCFATLIYYASASDGKGEFQSDALIVPEHCLFDHIYNQSICQSFDDWNNTAAHSCLDRAMQLRSFAMLLPCDVDLFSGVEFVCCPKNGEAPKKSICSRMFFPNSTCSKVNFLCRNGRCIDRQRRCDGRNDCGDSSDESYCNTRFRCPEEMSKCPQKDSKCIFNDWFCDGIIDCEYGEDEKKCDGNEMNEQRARVKAISWLMKQRNSQSGTETWGSSVDKSAVLLHLSSINISTNSSRETRKEMTYEVTIHLLSRLSKRKLQEIPSQDLASYINAFLVTCLDPRKFHGMDIVQELRSRVDRQIYISPYALLSLCNAGDTITASDTKILIDIFGDKPREFWTDVQSMAVMALACASRQPGSHVSAETIRELTLELKLLQYRSGMIENLQTTALVLQALISAAPEEDPDNFDHQKMIHQIMAMQEADGSFGSFQNTYYVLPVLSCQSLINVSSDHCEQNPARRDEKFALKDLAQRVGPKIRVSYSLWIGDGRDLERNLALRVPANTSFYGIMEMAAEVDSQYRFEYVVKDGKPYVNAISSYQNDPESEMFWYYYPVVNGQRTLKFKAISEQSPADVIAKDNDNFVMWYRSESFPG